MQAILNKIIFSIFFLIISYPIVKDSFHFRFQISHSGILKNASISITQGQVSRCFYCT